MKQFEVNTADYFGVEELCEICCNDGTEDKCEEGILDKKESCCHFKLDKEELQTCRRNDYARNSKNPCYSARILNRLKRKNVRFADVFLKRSGKNMNTAQDFGVGCLCDICENDGSEKCVDGEHLETSQSCQKFLLNQEALNDEQVRTREYNERGNQRDCTRVSQITGTYNFSNPFPTPVVNQIKRENPGQENLKPWYTQKIDGSLDFPYFFCVMPNRDHRVYKGYNIFNAFNKSYNNYLVFPTKYKDHGCNVITIVHTNLEFQNWILRTAGDVNFCNNISYKTLGTKNNDCLYLLGIPKTPSIIITKGTTLSDINKVLVNYGRVDYSIRSYWSSWINDIFGLHKQLGYINYTDTGYVITGNTIKRDKNAYQKALKRIKNKKISNPKDAISIIKRALSDCVYSHYGLRGNIYYSSNMEDILKGIKLFYGKKGKSWGFKTLKGGIKLLKTFPLEEYNTNRIEFKDKEIKRCKNKRLKEKTELGIKQCTNEIKDLNVQKKKLIEEKKAMNEIAKIIGYKPKKEKRDGRKKGS